MGGGGGVNKYNRLLAVFTERALYPLGDWILPGVLRDMQAQQGAAAAAAAAAWEDTAEKPP